MSDQRCENFCPPGYGGHWRDWHRGHGCELDPDGATDQPLVPRPEGHLHLKQDHRELTKTKVHTRLWDLVRFCRHELHREGLITNEEYAELAAAENSAPGSGSPSAQRLATYDALLATVEAQTKENARLNTMLRLSNRAIETLALCPDHRDKGTGDRCIVCKFEESARREARAERAEARADEAAPRANRFDCVECGRGVAVDEDGGCRTCGRDAQPVLAADPPSPVVPEQEK